MRVSECFSGSYAEARSRFLERCRDANAVLRSYENTSAPRGREAGLWTDVARFGDPRAPAALVLISGTHGIEGYAGSACQLRTVDALLPTPADPPVTVYAIHALNPYGFALGRRVNEDNVDVNRNFVDHDAPPANDDYATVHPYLLPAGWDGAGREAAEEGLRRLAAAKGMTWLQAAITMGQYTHPDGLFYGGREPVWSNRVLRRFVSGELTGHGTVAVIDLHTGLGEHGQAEVIFRGVPGSHDEAVVTSWYGAVTSSERGDSSSTVIGGNTPSAFREELPAARVLPVTLEFGTHPPLTVLEALREEQWLTLHPGAASEDVRARVVGTLREAFYCSDARWRTDVLEAGERIVGAALAGLAGTP